MKAGDQKAAEGILYTDQYQFTMAQLYYRLGLHEKQTQFEYYFRSYPNYGQHRAGYCINAGLEGLLDWMSGAKVTQTDIDYLRSQQSGGGKQLFGDDFLGWLGNNGSFECISLRAVPEGRVVHPGVPLAVVEGNLAVAQILETPLLNHLNYPTLIATKAARIKESTQGQLVLEFGLRRAQEKAANAGARAALIGGADFSSNVGISHVLGFPPKGTHAHSMVQVFLANGMTELDAFRAYADLYPDDCTLLVDTINTLESGLPNAIRVFEELKKKGHKPVGVRLDSGDLAYLAIRSAKLLDAAGFPEVGIVLSNQLDELVIWQIITQIQQEAEFYGVDPDKLVKRLVYGVGTGLISSKGASALDGVYKLVSIQNEGDWVPAIKISETREKTLNPGEKNVWRLYDRRGKATADLIGLCCEKPDASQEIILRHPTDDKIQRCLEPGRVKEIEPLLEDILVEGKLVYDLPSIESMREMRQKDVDRLDTGIRRMIYPHKYHVSISQELWDLKTDLINEMQSR